MRWFMPFHLSRAAVSSLVSVLFVSVASAAGYLRIDDIPGESRAAGHENEIDIAAVSWSVSVPEASVSGSTRSRSRAEVGPLVLSKMMDKASPYLALAAMNGRAFPEMVLTVTRDDGDRPLEYLRITLENVSVGGYAYSGSTTPGSTVPYEEIILNFENINFRYTETADDNSAGDEHEIEYDIVAGV